MAAVSESGQGISSWSRSWWISRGPMNLWYTIYPTQGLTSINLNRWCSHFHRLALISFTHTSQLELQTFCVDRQSLTRFSTWFKSKLPLYFYFSLLLPLHLLFLFPSVLKIQQHWLLRDRRGVCHRRVRHSPETPLAVNHRDYIFNN